MTIFVLPVVKDDPASLPKPRFAVPVVFPRALKPKPEFSDPVEYRKE